MVSQLLLCPTCLLESSVEKLKSVVMWHKCHREEDAAAPSGKRLRDNLTDLFNSGAVGGERAQNPKVTFGVPK